MRHVPKLVLAGALAGLAVPGSALAGQASLSPAAGAPGSTVMVHGAGFPGSKRVTVRLSGRAAVKVRASSGGSFTARVKAPRGRRGWLTVTSRSGSRKVVNRFYATGTGAGQVVEVASTNGKRLRLTPGTLTAGDTMRLDGAGFKKGRTVKLSGFGLSRTFTASRSGRFTALVSVPDSLKGGTYRTTLRAAGVRLVLSVKVKAATIQSVPSHVPPIGPVAPPTTTPVTPPPPPPPPVVPAKKPPVNTVAPNLTYTAGADGKVHDGTALSVTAGTWSNSPTSYAYQWQRCTDTSGCTAIAGATTTKYTAGPADVGFSLSVVVTATNADGSASSTSNGTDAVAAKVYPFGQIALWHMDDVAGKMTDSSGNAHTGVTHSIGFGQPGHLGTAFGFNGSNSSVTVPIGDMSPGPQNMAMSIWMKTTLKPPVPGPQDWDLLRAGFYATGAEYKMEYYPDGAASCGFKGDAGYKEVHSDPTAIGAPNLADGQWHQITCKRVGNYVQTIVDGGAPTQKYQPIGTIVVGDDLAVGAHPGSEFFNGQLDEASITFG